jgi:hypothetical protein
MAFYPRDPEDLSRFVNYFKITLEAESDYYTYPLLKGAPSHSIAGSTYLGIVAIATYGGKNPWDVMRENGFVYNLLTGLLVPKESVTIFIELPRTTNYYTARTALIQPGSRLPGGDAILTYDGEYDVGFQTLRVRSVEYE